MGHIIPGFIIGLREGLEAFLIITLILEYLNKLKRKDLHTAVKKGMIVGLLSSIILGIILWFISIRLANGSNAIGKLWEALASFVAVSFISYFIYWMIQNGKILVSNIKESVDSNLSTKGLFILSAVAVAREGAEIALFAFTAENKLNYLAGNLSGVIVAALLAILIYHSLVKVDISLIFKITLIYLILQAGYLFGYAIHEFLSALKTLELISADALILTKLFNFSDTVLNHKTGTLGIFLNILIGWYSKPEIIQSISQIGFVAIFLNLWRKKNRSS